MRILTTAILASGLMLGSANLATAQLGGLKDLATDAATDAAKDKASGVLGGSSSGLLGNSSIGDAASGVLGNSEPGSITSSQLSGQESLTAGKVLLGGGSTTDAAIAVGRSRLESRGKEFISGQVENPGSLLGGEAPAPAPSYSAPAIACPAGTQAQADGTCMVTGDWGG